MIGLPRYFDALVEEVVNARMGQAKNNALHFLCYSNFLVDLYRCNRTMTNQISARFISPIGLKTNKYALTEYYYVEFKKPDNENFTDDEIINHVNTALTELFQHRRWALTLNRKARNYV